MISGKEVSHLWLKEVKILRCCAPVRSVLPLSYTEIKTASLCMAAMESSSCRMKCGISSSLSLRLAAKKMRLSIVWGRVASCIQESMRIQQTSKHCVLVREEQGQSPAHRRCAWPACRPRSSPVSRICPPHPLQPWPCVGASPQIGLAALPTIDVTERLSDYSLCR